MSALTARYLRGGGELGDVALSTAAAPVVEWLEWDVRAGEVVRLDADAVRSPCSDFASAFHCSSRLLVNANRSAARHERGVGREPTDPNSGGRDLRATRPCCCRCRSIRERRRA